MARQTIENRFNQRRLAVIIRHLLTRFSRQDEAKQLLHEQQKSEEALAIKREGDSLVDFCGYLMASVVCDGMLIGNAENGSLRIQSSWMP